MQIRVILSVFFVLIFSSLFSHYVVEQYRLSMVKGVKFTQLPSLPGEPIKWIAVMPQSAISSNQHLMEIPKSAQGVKVTSIAKSVVDKVEFDKARSIPLTTLTKQDRQKLSELSKKNAKSAESLALIKSINSHRNKTANKRVVLENQGLFSHLFSNVQNILSMLSNPKASAANDEVNSADNTTEVVPPTVGESQPQVIDLSSVGAGQATEEEQQKPNEDLNNTDTDTGSTTEQGLDDTTDNVPADTDDETGSATTTPATATPPVITDEPESVATTSPINQSTSTDANKDTPTDETKNPAGGNTGADAPESALETPEASITEQIATSTATSTDILVEVEYQTPAPVIAEADTDTGKIVTVSDDAGDVEGLPHTTNVLAFTNIPEIYKVGQESKIKIKWKTENNQEMSFHAYDTNSNGKLDYVEWIVPHLSTQTFEIIFISKAFQLDQDQNTTADIYDIVATQDGVFATIPENNYIRATFNDILDKTKDITIHAKPASSDNSASVEIYPVYTDSYGNQTEGAKVATINNINSLNSYRVLLPNLREPTDTFDLKVVNANLDVDYIVDPTAWLTGWTHRKKITISNANVDADLSNFPALVSIANDADMATALANGYDIRFTDSGGRSTLYYERESWTGGGGASATANFWVNVPAITTATSTDIYVYYGKADATDGQSVANVWGNGYAGVWHLKETGTNPRVFDSTANARNSTSQTWTPATGKIGGGGVFGNGKEILCPSTLSVALPRLTMSAWIMPSGTGSNNTILDNFYTSYRLMAGSGRGLSYINGIQQNISYPLDTTGSVWQHLVGVYDSIAKTFTLYYNGISAGTVVADLGSVAAEGTSFRIGVSTSNTQFFVGSIDEPHISAVARSASWIKFEYYNQKDASGGTFGSGQNQITISTQENNVTWLSGWSNRKKITIDHTKVGSGTEDQTNFPILVSLTGLSGINANGTDIRFTSADGGTYLAREIESYATGTLTAWVKIPTLSHDYDTVIYMYYGNSGATEPVASSTYGSQSVWTNGFAGVWHLNNPTNPNDSTSNAKNLTNNGSTAVTGQVSGAGSFASSSSQYIGGSNIGNMKTISYWVKSNTNDNGGIELNANQYIGDSAIPEGMVNPTA